MDFYPGTCCTCIYKAKNERGGSRGRLGGGEVTPPRSASGVICAKFSSSLPTKAIGHRVRAVLYPLRARHCDIVAVVCKQ
ncbi:60S ribosomal protein L35a-like [Anguilla anguilla]|uniref:60S ribosomal protein L35a-like n=1 Tax=Anguilla anguilla TaxID=7936 RepID=UPI0015B1AE6E|nr:60S ribosomal protein L35a-like [Anguilla anguilla]XP_035276103.1 60S ribosomal protein L35a-like [Anguilla anguilla]